MTHPILILLRHDAWATRQLLLACRDCTHDQFHHAFDIGPGSLHNTFAHIIGAMIRWADRIDARPLRTGPDRTPDPSTPQRLLQLLDDAALDLQRIAQHRIDHNALDHRITFTGPDGRPRSCSTAVALIHIATHGMYHRAQIVNIRRRLGLVPAPSDLDPIEWESLQRP